jgi:hypothetical protein
MPLTFVPFVPFFKLMNNVRRQLLFSNIPNLNTLLDNKHIRFTFCLSNFHIQNILIHIEFVLMHLSLQWVLMLRQVLADAHII